MCRVDAVYFNLCLMFCIVSLHQNVYVVHESFGLSESELNYIVLLTCMARLILMEIPHGICMPFDHVFLRLSWNSVQQPFSAYWSSVRLWSNWVVLIYDARCKMQDVCGFDVKSAVQHVGVQTSFHTQHDCFLVRVHEYGFRWRIQAIIHIELTVHACSLCIIRHALTCMSD